MNINPQSEEQVQAANLAPKGDYPFEVLDASEQKSSTGNDMIKLNVGIYDGDKIRWRCFDYVLDAMAAKLRHCCDTLGILTKYEQGTLCAADFMGRAGYCKVNIKIDKDGKYRPKNEIKDYICRTAKPIAAHPQPATPTSGSDNGELPF